jgi:DNA-binding beta-propeller fold protein YncE
MDTVRPRLTSAALLLLVTVQTLVLSGCYFISVSNTYLVLYVPSFGEIRIKLANSLGQISESGPPVSINPNGQPNALKTYMIPSVIVNPDISSFFGFAQAAAFPSTTSPVLIISEAFADVGVYDPVTGAQIAVMPVNGNPFDLVSAPGQTTVYAVIYPSMGAPPAVAVIDATQWAITATIPLPAGTYPQFAAISPDGSTLYVDNQQFEFSGLANPVTSILVIDTASRTVRSTITVPSSVNATLFADYVRLEVSPDGTLLYAEGTNAVEVIDTLTLLPVSVIGFNPGIFIQSHAHIVFSPDGTAVYIVTAGPKGPSITVINTITSQITNNFPVGTASTYLSDLSLNNSILLAYDASTGSVYPINATTGQVGTPIPEPAGFAPKPMGFLSSAQ